jgi:hypothetical protein
MRGLNCAQIEVDEIWGFIGAKRNRADAVGAYGDVFLTAIRKRAIPAIANFIGD